RGGIRDPLGGGCHRSAPDREWLVPHFEKMLYDNALLVPAYLETAAITKRPDFADVVTTTLDYVLREMTADTGAFFATQDADSEGEEGKFFVWDHAEVVDLLGPENADLFCSVYDIAPGGNWEGHAIPQRLKTPAADSARLGVPTDELEARLAGMRAELFETRERRIKPARDDKHITSWNGLMIAATAQAGVALGEPKYVDAAVRAADFQIGQALEFGGLQHSVKDGVSSGPAFLDDFACLIDGLVEVGSATSDPCWIDHAVKFAEVMLAEFRDTSPEGDGGFFYSRPDPADPLIVRLKDGQDNATPSGNGMAATALLKLHTLTLRPEFEEAAVEVLDRLSGQLVRNPAASGQSLIALDHLVDPPPEVVIADGPDTADGDALMEEVRTTPRHGVLSWRVPYGSEPDEAHPLAKLLAGKTPVDGRAAAYVCRGGACLAPVTDAAALAKALTAGPA
ncbi:MAG: thioredoxin domain-containing protein, partial [Planctomycetota bacterium]